MSMNNPQNSNNSQNTTSNIVQNIVGNAVNNLTSNTVNSVSNAANLYAIANGYKDGNYVNSSLGLGAIGMNLLNNPLSNTVGLGIPLVGDIINKDWKGLGFDSARILADKILYNKLYTTTTTSIPATLSNASNTALNSAANATGITNSNLNAIDPGNAGLDNNLDSKTSSIAPPDNSLKKAALVSNIISKIGMNPLLSGGISIIGTETLAASFLQGLAGATFPLSVPALFAGLGLSIADMVKKKQWEKDLNRYNQRSSDFDKYNDIYSEVPDLNNLNNYLLNGYLERALVDRSAADSLINGVDNSRNMLTNLTTDPQIQQTLANISDTIQEARLNIQDNNIKELVLDPYSYSNKTPQELNLYKAAIQKNIIELDGSLEPYSNLAGNGVGKEMYKQAIKEIDSIIADKAYKGGVNYGKYTPENSGPSIYEKAQLTKLSQEKSLLVASTDFWQKRVDSLKEELEYNSNSNPLMNLILQFKNKDKIENLKVAEATLSNYKLRAQDVDNQIASLQGSVEKNTNSNETVDKTPVEANTGGQNITENNQNTNQDPQKNTIDPINNNQGGTIDNAVNNQYEEVDDGTNTNNALQGKVVENVINSDTNSTSTPIFPWNIKDKEIDNAVFDSVIKTVIDNWNEKQSKRIYNNNFDKSEYMANTRKWAPEKGNAWHEDNFKNASTVEQVIYADSIHLMNIPEKDLTPEDRDHFEENIKLLSVLKSLKDGTMKQHVSEELERMKLIEEIRKVAASKGLTMPDLSNINNQQMPYSRIPRGLGVSRENYRGMILPAQIPPMPIPGEPNPYDTSNIDINIKKELWKLNGYHNISKNKDIILKEATKNDLPPELIGGILYNESNYLNIFLDPFSEWMKRNNPEEEPTVGIAQVSALSALIETDLSFNPKTQDLLLNKYSKLNNKELPPTNKNILEAKLEGKEYISNKLKEIRNNRKEELKSLLKKYYANNATSEDIKILNALYQTKKYINDKKKIRQLVINKRNWLKNDQNSIQYLAQLLKRIKTEECGSKKELTDNELCDIAEKYNPNNILLSSQSYVDSFKEKLPTVRKWLK